jgi:DNA-directed RNA polymerase subunit E'/Rpb7
MEYTAVFEEAVSLTPKDLRSPIKSLDIILEGKLRARLEGKCSRHGFVLSDSVRVLSRSMGTIDRGRFTGNILFHVQAEGKVLNPSDKTILDGEVIRKNKMGLYLNYKDAIRIIVPRDANIGKDEFEHVEMGETITVEIKKSRFQVNDPYILSVGLFLRRKEGAAVAPSAPETPVESEEEEENEEENEEEESKEEEFEEEESEAKEEESESKEDESEAKEADESEAKEADESEAKEADEPAAKKRFQLRRR